MSNSSRYSLVSIMHVEYREMLVYFLLILCHIGTTLIHKSGREARIYVK